MFHKNHENRQFYGGQLPTLGSFRAAAPDFSRHWDQAARLHRRRSACRRLRGKCLKRRLGGWRVVSKKWPALEEGAACILPQGRAVEKLKLIKGVLLQFMLACC
ncbi:MAG TPA: hypothetical protein PKM06_03600 [Bacillota bacterium]|nr:hypothetical protein [Bacillota bacterium]